MGRAACVMVEPGLKSWDLQASVVITEPSAFPCHFGQSIAISLRLLFSVTSKVFQFWSWQSILDLFGLLAYMMKTLYMARGISYFSEDTLGVDKTTLKTGLALVGKYKPLLQVTDAAIGHCGLLRTRVCLFVFPECEILSFNIGRVLG